MKKGVRPEACNFIKKETLAQVFSCEFCEISKNTFFTEHLLATAFEFRNSHFKGIPVSGFHILDGRLSLKHIRTTSWVCFHQC